MTRSHDDGKTLSRRRALAVLAAPLVLTAFSPAAAKAASRIYGERSISLFNVHTGENLTTIYWQDGRYVTDALRRSGVEAFVGPTWSTDAPFRETAAAIDAARAKGALAVEMEAAALYAFARTRAATVLCVAHVTNTMGQAERDFEKGEADGTADALRLLAAIVAAVRLSAGR